MKQQHIRRPDWLKIKLPEGENFRFVQQTVREHHLHTICQSGHCPNMGECWGNKTASFMILGDICTRACRFCNTKTGKPLPVDPNEAEMLADSIHKMGLRHAVITSVDRDDLPDGGAQHWANCIRAVHALEPKVTLETLIPDFDANEDHMHLIARVKPEVLSHNLETVKRLTPQVRSKAKYDVSLRVIRYFSQQGLKTKSGLMLGLGERLDEVQEAIRDLHDAGCKVLTLGQYLQPSKKHLAVERYVHPDEFEALRQFALEIGFEQVESAPLVRSSYHAEKHV